MNSTFGDIIILVESKKGLLSFAILTWVVLENAQAVGGVLPRPLMAFFVVAMFAVAVICRSWPVIHLSVFYSLVLIIAPTLSLDLLKVPALGAAIWFGVSVLLLLPFASGRSNLKWFQRGRIGRVEWILIAATSVLAAGGLILWANWTDNLGIGVEMMKGVSHLNPFFIALVGIPAFALLNAFSEEVVYRGMLQQALMDSVGDKPFAVIPLQASVFAAIHFAVGFPNGFVGYAMVFVWGSMLGYLRRQTNGMLAPYLVHVAADLVIFYYVFSLV